MLDRELINYPQVLTDGGMNTLLNSRAPESFGQELTKLRQLNKLAIISLGHSYLHAKETSYSSLSGKLNNAMKDNVFYFYLLTIIINVVIK